VTNSRPGYACWFDKLPEHIKPEFEEARRRFDRNIHQKSAYARAIIQVAKDRGIEIAGENRVIEWLSRGR
jgi:hypothetical protein